MGMGTGIIPMRQVVIIGVPATLGIIDKVRPGTHKEKNQSKQSWILGLPSNPATVLVSRR
jgi:hypothetical protein